MIKYQYGFDHLTPSDLSDIEVNRGILNEKSNELIMHVIFTVFFSLSLNWFKLKITLF